MTHTAANLKKLKHMHTSEVCGLKINDNIQLVCYGAILPVSAGIIPAGIYKANVYSLDLPYLYLQLYTSNGDGLSNEVHTLNLNSTYGKDWGLRYII